MAWCLSCLFLFWCYGSGQCFLGLRGVRSGFVLRKSFNNLGTEGKVTICMYKRYVNSGKHVDVLFEAPKP